MPIPHGDSDDVCFSIFRLLLYISIFITSGFFFFFNYVFMLELAVEKMENIIGIPIY